MEKGFTLIEILISLGVFVILLGSGLFISLDAYKSTIYEREFHLFIQILEKTRSEALNNLEEMSHGLKLEEDRLIIFSGNLYDPERSDNEEIKRDKKISIHGPSEVIFHNIDVITSTSAAFEISDGIRSRTVFIGKEGQINW